MKPNNQPNNPFEAFLDMAKNEANKTQTTTNQPNEELSTIQNNVTEFLEKVTETN